VARKGAVVEGGEELPTKEELLALEIWGSGPHDHPVHHSKVLVDILNCEAIHVVQPHDVSAKGAPDNESIGVKNQAPGLQWVPDPSGDDEEPKDPEPDQLDITGSVHQVCRPPPERGQEAVA